MYSERLQILVSSDQRRRLEREAQRRGASVAAVVRDAVEAQLAGVTPEDRRAAIKGIRALHGRFVSPEELNRIVEQERDGELDVIAGRVP